MSDVFSQSENLITYDGLLKKMKNALKRQEFFNKVNEKYQAIIVDEFQDTDKDQWEIFKTLFSGNKRSFFLVGDPKQSIYRFRNADLYVYFEAAKLLGEENKQILDVNYRSNYSLVKALNSLFSGGNDKSCWLHLPKEKTTIPYIPIKAKDESHKNISEASIHFIIGKDKIKKRWPSSYIEEKLFLPYIAAEIQNLAKTQSYCDIAILVKDRYQAQRVIHCLKENNISYIAKNQKPITSSIAFHSLKALFEAILSPKDNSKLRILLKTPYIDESYQSIETYDENLIDKAVFNIFYLKEILEEKWLFHFFREFLQTKWSDEEITVEKRLIRNENLQIYRDTMQLIEVIFDSLKDERGTSIEEILSIFSKLSKLDKDDDEKIKRWLNFDEKGVQIMTMHMSKGLEYSYVFALGLAMRSPAIEEEFLLEKDSIEEFDLEKNRQFYVAVTRAKEKVYIPVAIDESNSPIAYGTASPFELFYAYKMRNDNEEDVYSIIENLSLEGFNLFVKTLENTSLEVIETPKEIQQEKEQEKAILVSPPSNEFYTQRKTVFSFSNLSSKNKDEKEKEINESYIFSSSKLPVGPKTGIILHEVFEKIFSSRLSNFYEKECYKQIIDNVLKHTFLKNETNVICEMVKRALNAPLLEDRSLFLRDISINQMLIEEEFLFPIGKNFLKGFIDFIFFYGDKYYLLDWKTNWLGDNADDYTTEKLSKVMQAHNYHLQGSIYFEAIERLLKMKKMKKDFGGMFFIFLRGLQDEKSLNQRGIFHFIPDKTELNLEKELLCLE